MQGAGSPSGMNQLYQPWEKFENITSHKLQKPSSKPGPGAGTVRSFLSGSINHLKGTVGSHPPSHSRPRTLPSCLHGFRNIICYKQLYNEMKGTLISNTIGMEYIHFLTQHLQEPLCSPIDIGDNSINSVSQNIKNYQGVNIVQTN